MQSRAMVIARRYLPGRNRLPSHQPQQMSVEAGICWQRFSSTRLMRPAHAQHHQQRLSKGSQTVDHDKHVDKFAPSANLALSSNWELAARLRHPMDGWFNTEPASFQSY
ncbi:hypothetical protein PMIN03_011534 [Paraphaeosphaeria minitans]